MVPLQFILNLLDQFPYLVWIKTKDGKLVYVNEAYTLFCKKGKKEIIGKTEKEVWNLIEGEKLFKLYEIPIRDKENNIKLYGGIGKSFLFYKEILTLFSRVYNNFLGLNTKEVENDTKILLHKYIKDLAKKLESQIKCDVLSILIYKENTKELFTAFKSCLGKQVHILNPYNAAFTLNNERDIHKYLNKFMCTKDIEDSEYKSILIKNNIEYSVCFPINIKGKLVGITHIGFCNQDNIFEIPYGLVKVLSTYLGLTLQNMIIGEESTKYLVEHMMQQKEVEVFFQSIKELFCIIDENYNVEALGNGWKKILGWDKADVQALLLKTLIHPEDLEKVKFVLEMTKATPGGRLKEAICRCLNNKGEYLIICWNTRYLYEERKYVATGRDITQEYEAEQKNLQLKQQKEIEGIKKEFLSHVTKGFNQCVQQVLEDINLLQNEANTQRIVLTEGLYFQKHIDTMKQNTLRVLKLSKNLNSIEEASNIRRQLNIKTCDMVALIQGIMNSTKEYVMQKGIHLDFKTNMRSLWIKCDEEKIERVLLNLISNSLKYTHKGGYISINLGINRQYVIIKVCDNGEGIKEELLEKIFDKFVVGNDARQNKKEGTGIGLSVARDIIKKHQGFIDVESKVGEGSCFTIHLPQK